MNTGDTTTNDSEATARKSRLLALIDNSLEIETNLAAQDTAVTLQAINNIITTADVILSEGLVQDRAEHTSEVVMDAQIMNLNHDLVTKILQDTDTFSRVMYQNAILDLVQKPNGIKWDAITEIAWKIMRTSSCWPSMMGALKLELVEFIPKERQRSRRTKLAEEKQPENIEHLQSVDTGAKKVTTVHQQLKEIFSNENCETMPFFKLIIDPHNPMQTVENALHMSFLLKDKLIAMEKGADGHPTVRLIGRDGRGTEEFHTQAVCTVDNECIQEMIAFYDIKEALLHPARDHEEVDMDNDFDDDHRSNSGEQSTP